MDGLCVCSFVFVVVCVVCLRCCVFHLLIRFVWCLWRGCLASTDGSFSDLCVRTCSSAASHKSAADDRYCRRERRQLLLAPPVNPLPAMCRPAPLLQPSRQRPPKERPYSIVNELNFFVTQGIPLCAYAILKSGVPPFFTMELRRDSKHCTSSAIDGFAARSTLLMIPVTSMLAAVGCCRARGRQRDAAGQPRVCSHVLQRGHAHAVRRIVLLLWRRRPGRHRLWTRRSPTALLLALYVARVNFPHPVGHHANVCRRHPTRSRRSGYQCGRCRHL